MDRDKQTLSEYDIEGKEMTLSIYERNENSRDGYVCIYQCDKVFYTLTLECTYAAQETTISKMKDIVDM